MKSNHAPFDFEGKFYKGNIHCHSVVSDGVLTHGELIENYKAKGYSFLCFSDHEIYTDLTELNTDSFICLPGVEWSGGVCHDPHNPKTHHVIGLRGTADMISSSREQVLKKNCVLPFNKWADGSERVDEMAGYLADRGFIAIYCHPLWSRTKPSVFGNLAGYSALEIYNHGCELESHTGYSAVYWDELLLGGAKINCIASDDNHNRLKPDDSFGGCISVKAEGLTNENIISSIITGSYYSTSGPEIYDLYIKDGAVRVSCSPVHHINYIAGNYISAGFTEWSADGEDSIIGSEYKLSGSERYLRVECVDKFGKTAWSNPFYF